MSAPSYKSAFTLLEMLVATAVFAILMMVVLQMTSGLMSGATRMDENLKLEQDVRLFFDIMRRDLAQARIGTNQNQFYGTETNITFVSSSQRLKTNYVSDQRLVTYFLSRNTNVTNQTVYDIRRAVVDPSTNNFPNVWNPLVTNWWTNAGFSNYVTNTSNYEVVLSGIKTNASFFSYYPPNATNSTNYDTWPNPPRGVKVKFNLLGKRALTTAVTNANTVKEIDYDVDLNIPPVFNP